MADSAGNGAAGADPGVSLARITSSGRVAANRKPRLLSLWPGKSLFRIADRQWLAPWNQPGARNARREP